MYITFLTTTTFKLENKVLDLHLKLTKTMNMIFMYWQLCNIMLGTQLLQFLKFK